MNFFDLARITTETGTANVDFHDRLGSTSDRAMELLKSEAVEGHSNSDPIALPLLVLTANQTAGRGQRERSWFAGPGSLTFTLCLANASASAVDSLLPLAVAVCVCEAIEVSAPILQTKIKWPNDVLLNNKKLAGILVENVRTKNAAVAQTVTLIGVGINVNNSAAEVLIRSDATNQSEPGSLIDFVGEVDLNRLLIANLQRLLALPNVLSQQPEMIVRKCSERLVLLHRFVEIQLPDGDLISGTCQGLGNSGELLLTSDGQLRSVFSGTVIGYH